MFLTYVKFFLFLELNSYVIYSLIFFAYMVGSSLLLLKGLNNNLRGFLLPWLIGMGFVVIFLLVWSIWLLYGYYIYVSNFYNITFFIKKKSRIWCVFDLNFKNVFLFYLLIKLFNFLDLFSVHVLYFEATTVKIRTML